MARQLYCIDPGEALTTGTYQGEEGKLKIFLELSDTIADLYDPLPNGLTAEALLLDVPTVHSDDSFFRASGDVTVSLDNTEGVFTPMDLVGWYVQIWGFSCNDEKRLVFSGQVVSQQNQEETRLTLRDLPIGSLDVVLPQRTIEEGNFPTSQSQGSEIPIVFGRTIRHRCPNLSRGYETALAAAIDNTFNTPISYSLAEDVPGLAFTPADRIFSGIPTATGFFPLVYRMTDADGKIVTRAITLEVRDVPISYLFVFDSSDSQLYRIDASDPDTIPDDGTREYDLPGDFAGPLSVVSHNGAFYAVESRPGRDRLWRINPDDPSDRSGIYGIVGTLPVGLTIGTAAASFNGKLLIFDQQSPNSELWNINPDNPPDVSGEYGHVGNLPSEVGLSTGATVHNNRLYIVTQGGGLHQLWHINPDDPSDESGDYGLVGDLPSGLEHPRSVASHGGELYVATTTGDELWRINPDNPSDTSGVFGFVSKLPVRLTDPQGMASHDNRLFIGDSDGGMLFEINPDTLYNPSVQRESSGLTWTCLAFHQDRLYAGAAHDSGTNSRLYLINHENPGDTSGDYGEIGFLPSGLARITALVSHNGKLYGTDDTGNELWHINPDNPTDESGDYGLVGSFPSGLDTPTGMASLNGKLYVADSVGDELWHINPDDPGDKTGDYGLIGTLPETANFSPESMTSHEGELYIGDEIGSELWRINPDDPSDESGDYGLVGDFPSVLQHPYGMTSNTVIFQQPTLTTVDDLADLVAAINKDFTITFPEVDTGRAFSVVEVEVDSVNGMAAGDSIQVGIGTDQAEVATISSVNPANNEITLFEGLGQAHAVDAIVVNHSVVNDFLLGEGVAGSDNFSKVTRVYHNGRALPRIEYELSAAASLSGAGVAVEVQLPDRLRVNSEGWYQNFTADFFEGSTLRGELVVSAYNALNNTITVTNPGATFNYDKIRLDEHRFFDGSQSYPHAGLAFIRVAKNYTGEITADVEGFDITDPREVIRTLLKNDTWGAGETEDFFTEGGDLSVYKFEGSITRGNLRGIIEEVSLFRHFKLFRKKDGIHFRAFEPESNPPSLPLNREDYVQAPSLSRASLTERVTRLNLSYRPAGRDREMTQSLSEDQGLGDLGGEREIETPYIYEGVTADRVLWYQHQIELAARRTLECSIDVCSLEGDDLEVGKVLRLPADLIENTTSDWLILGLRERVDLTIILSLLEYNADLYTYPAGRVISVSDTYDPETDFSETPSEPVRDLDITAVTCDTIVDDSTTVEENCIILEFELPEENYSGADIEYQTPTGALALAGQTGPEDKIFTFAVPRQDILYNVFVTPRSPHNDLKGYPVSGAVNFEDLTPLSLPVGLTVVGGSSSGVPFVRVSITSGYTPGSSFSRVEIRVDFRVGNLIYETIERIVESDDISTLWDNGGLTIPATISNLPSGTKTAVVRFSIYSTDRVGNSRQFTVDT